MNDQIPQCIKDLVKAINDVNKMTKGMVSDGMEDEIKDLTIYMLARALEPDAISNMTVDDIINSFRQSAIDQLTYNALEG